MEVRKEGKGKKAVSGGKETIEGNERRRRRKGDHKRRRHKDMKRRNRGRK